MWTCNSSGLGSIWALSIDQDICSLELSVATTSRMSYGSSCERKCGGKIGSPSVTMWSTSTIILWSLSGSESSSTLRESAICTTSPSTHIHFIWRAGSTMSNIGLSATNNYISMIFSLQLGTDLLHLIGMNWITRSRTIVMYPTQNGVTLFLPRRLKMTGKEMQPNQETWSL